MNNILYRCTAYRAFYVKRNGKPSMSKTYIEYEIDPAVYV